MALNWSAFKANMGEVNGSISYIDDEGTKILIENQCEFDEAVKFARSNGNQLKLILKFDNVETDDFISICDDIINNSDILKADKMKKKSSASPNKKENGCQCKEPPKWFNQWIKKLKKEMVVELKSTMNETIFKEFEKLKKRIKNKPESEGHSDAKNLPSPSIKTKKKKADKDSPDHVLESREFKLLKKMEKLSSSKTEKLESKVENKPLTVFEEKKRLLEKKRLKSKGEKKNSEMFRKKLDVYKSALFLNKEIKLRVRPGKKFSTRIGVTNNSCIPWVNPYLDCVLAFGVSLEKPNISLPPLDYGNRAEVTVKGRISERPGLYFFQCRIMDGSEDLSTRMICWIEAISPKAESEIENGEGSCSFSEFSRKHIESLYLGTRAENQNNETAEPNNPHIAVSEKQTKSEQSQILKSSQKKIEENIKEIEDRLQEINVFWSLTDESEKDKRKSESNIETDAPAADMNNQPNDSKEDEKAKKFKEKNKEESDSESDSELSIIFTFEDDDNFIMIPSPEEETENDGEKAEKNKSAHESVESNEGASRPTECGINDSEKEFPKSGKPRLYLFYSDKVTPPTNPTDSSQPANASDTNATDKKFEKVPTADQENKAPFSVNSQQPNNFPFTNPLINEVKIPPPVRVMVSPNIPIINPANINIPYNLPQPTNSSSTNAPKVIVGNPIVNNTPGKVDKITLIDGKGIKYEIPLDSSDSVTTPVEFPKNILNRTPVNSYQAPDFSFNNSSSGISITPGLFDKITVVNGEGVEYKMPDPSEAESKSRYVIPVKTSDTFTITINPNITSAKSNEPPISFSTKTPKAAKIPEGKFEKIPRKPLDPGITSNTMGKNMPTTSVNSNQSTNASNVPCSSEDLIKIADMLKKIPVRDNQGKAIFAVNASGEATPVTHLIKGTWGVVELKDDNPMTSSPTFPPSSENSDSSTSSESPNSNAKFRQNFRNPQRLERSFAEDSNQAPTVNILPNILVNGASNVASMALSTAKSMFSNLQSAFVTEGKTEMGKPAWDPNMSRSVSMEALLKLFEMGFHDMEANQKFLLHNSNDLAKTVEQLIEFYKKAQRKH